MMLEQIFGNCAIRMLVVNWGPSDSFQLFHPVQQEGSPVFLYPFRRRMAICKIHLSSKCVKFLALTDFFQPKI